MIDGWSDSRPINGIDNPPPGDQLLWLIYRWSDWVVSLVISFRRFAFLAAKHDSVEETRIVWKAIAKSVGRATPMPASPSSSPCSVWECSFHSFSSVGGWLDRSGGKGTEQLWTSRLRNISGASDPKVGRQLPERLRRKSEQQRRHRHDGQNWNRNERNYELPAQ